MIIPELSWGNSEFTFKAFTEIFGIGESKLICHIRDIIAVIYKHLAGNLETKIPKEFLWRHTSYAFYLPVHGRFGHIQGNSHSLIVVRVG